MSAPFLNVKISPDAQAVLNQARAEEQAVWQRLARVIDRENQLTIAHITAERLTGHGPFPPEQGKLGVRTGLLRRSLRASKAVVEPGRILSTIGTNVVYAGIHETGGEIKRTQLAGSVRLRVDARGNRLRQSSNPRLHVFARSTHKLFDVVSFAGGRRFTIRMPMRAPIRRGIEDRAANYATALNTALAKPT